MYIPPELRALEPDENKLRELIVRTLRENLSEEKSDEFIVALFEEIQESSAYQKIKDRLPFWVPIGFAMRLLEKLLDAIIPDVFMSALNRFLYRKQAVAAR